MLLKSDLKSVSMFLQVYKGLEVNANIHYRQNNVNKLL